MYLENKGQGLTGPARIGRVTFSKTRKTVYCRDKTFQRISGYKANHVDVDTGEEYWISGPRRDGTDRLYGGNVPVEIDEDVRREHWTQIRGKPANRG